MPWAERYKAYSQTTTKAFQRYRSTNEYKYEVTIDLQNFFPTIHPAIICNYIWNRLGVICSSEDSVVLQKILTKLLMIQIKDKYISDNFGYTYAGKKWVEGIPQGLAHAYYFGNLCMVEIAEIYKKEFSKHSLPDMYFYVDDTKIFTNVDMDEEHKKVANNISKKLEKLSNQPLCSSFGSDNSEFSKFCNGMKLEAIKIHDFSSEKSTYIKITDTNYKAANLHEYSKLASVTMKQMKTLFSEQEEFNSFEKIKKIKEHIHREIERVEILESGDDLKILKRLLKFFNYRELILLQNQVENDTAEIQIFEEEKQEIIRLFSKDNLDELATAISDDILLSKIPFLLLRYPDNQIASSISSFEKNYVKDGAGYLTKIIQSTQEKRNKILKGADPIKYKSLGFKVRSGITQKKDENRNLESAIKLYEFNKIPSEVGYKNHEMTRIYNEIFEKHCYKIVNYRTEELERQFLNTYFSIRFDCYISDDLHILKHNVKPLYYNQVRLLWFIRNSFFSLKEFCLLFAEFENGDVFDYRLNEMSQYFKKLVCNPKLIDNLVQVHKYTTEIWQNGSKYLHFYTLHNQDHAIELIKSAEKFLKCVEHFQISQYDYYLLFISCYLHDIAMILHPDLISEFTNDTIKSNQIYMEYIDQDINKNDKVAVKSLLVDFYKKLDGFYEEHSRGNHVRDSGKFIKNSSDMNFLDKHVREIVAEISVGHGQNLYEVYYQKSDAQNQIASKKYLKILLRIADLLDMTANRISNPILLNSRKNMSEYTQFHWISHQAISHVELEVKYETHQNGDEESYLSSGAIIEKVIFVIYLNTKHDVAIGTPKQKNGNIKFYSYQNTEEQTSSDHFMKAWMNEKNAYLHEEVEELQNYLNTVPENIFKNEFEVHYRYNRNVSSLSNQDYEIIKNQISL